MMPFLSSFVVVALAEMGDKTQLIALALGLRYRRPWVVMLGILLATLVNHALASAVGRPVSRESVALVHESLIQESHG